MIKKIAVALLMSATLTISQQSTASLIYPGKLSNFDDGNVDGWTKGPRSNAQPEVITDEQGHRYLLVSSTGELTFDTERDPDSRLKVLNHSTWLPDYNLLGIVAIKVRMANLGKTPLHMRLFFGNTAQEKMCMTETAVELSPDKQWQDITFNMQQPGLICGSAVNTDRTIQPENFSIAGLKKNLNNIFFMSLETPDSDGKLVGTLGIDSIEALTSTSLGFVENSAHDQQLAILDLRTDVISNGELIQHISNTAQLTSVDGMSLRYQVDPDTGILKVLSEGKVETLRPVSAIMTEQSTPGVSYSKDGYKQLFTANNRRITAFPQSNAETEFSRLLQTLGLQIKHDGQANLAVFPQGGDLSGTWFSVRVDSVSILTDTTVPTGLSAKEYSNLTGVTEYIHSYSINGDMYQQSYHAVPADWEALRGYLLNTLKATQVRLSATGVISLLIAGNEYNTRISALVSPHDGGELPEKTELQGAGDMNKDGLPDFKVLYRNGQSQIIYLLP